jgi:hypothetical protein
MKGDVPCLSLELVVGRLVERVEIEQLDHHVVDHCEQVSSVREFNLVTVFYR